MNYFQGGGMNNEFSAEVRNSKLTELDGKNFDVAIIGGGITGSGIVNILAENGIKTILLEKEDFGSGTSSGSSKLVHGGLRYLQTGKFLEVYHLLQERNYLIEHTDIVKPLEFHILTGKQMWNPVEIGIGMAIYNAMSGKNPLVRYHRNHGVYSGDTDGFYSYTDGITVDSKLVIYNIVSAYRHGALCFNYTEALSIKKSGNLYYIKIRDTVSQKCYEISSKIVINAAGPWGNNILKMAGLPEESDFRLSKGIHLVFPFSLWKLKNAVVFKSSIDGRQIFIIPSGDVVYTGTTDTFVTDPDDFSVGKEDIEYLIKSLQSVFPDFTYGRIITTFSGIRVLLGSGDDPGKISRDFRISVTENFISVLGGKITDYRVGARKTARIISRLLGRKLKIKNMPYIDYSRKSDDIDNIIMYECPVKPEDILRRRLALRIYSLDMGKSIEDTVIKKMGDIYEGAYTDK